MRKVFCVHCRKIFVESRDIQIEESFCIHCNRYIKESIDNMFKVKK